MAKTMPRRGNGSATMTAATAVLPAPPPPIVMVDGVKPPELVADALAAAKTKAGLSVKDMLIRGFLAGAFLAFATSLAVLVRTQSVPFAGAVIFPVGFVLLVLLGFELATGNFALLPAGMADGVVTLRQTLRNWSWVYVANLAGCLLFAGMFYAALTNFGNIEPGPVGEAIKTTAIAKTAPYEALGATGWLLAIVKAVLANWMVTVGVLMAFVSRSTIGRIVAMWLPITTFFALGFEHSIVNMFVVPMGMLLGADISVGDWWMWNQIPVTIGNIIGGALFTGLAVYATHRTKPVV
jgi:formate transporter